MRFVFLLPLVFATSAMAAASSASDNILVELSRCDSSFFAALNRNAGAFASTPYLVKEGPVASFKVADRTDLDRSLRRFTPALKISGFETFGYFDEHLSLGGDEAVISWGFILRAPMATVLKATQASLWDTSRLQQDGDVYARSEQWDLAQPDAGWQKIDTPGGAESRPGTIDRVLQIEAYEKDPSMTRFACTLRGAVTLELLKAARPDLNATQLGNK
ncbi:MAG: hypothetical protein EPO09_01805 [Aquabacterium sp.]|uniref:hypothetical protein n=1 Tax=Aquabacterium sp. TaxID=1872578 RepID=UPI0012102205|nr:hypothetical protein [Aquabacterium sp.]TAK98925.1 MAG: hypothetical protein EPO09_01805 [Aquabacterium sp.]